MKTKITFDKEYIRGVSLKELKCNFVDTESNLPIVTEQLIIECIADLEKEFKDRNKLTHTASLFSKLDLFPCAKYNHMSLVRKELIEGIKIKQYHDFFDYVTKDYLSSGDFIDLYSDSGSDEQIKMWSQGDFNSNIMEESVSIADSNGYAVAQHYRMLRTSNAFTNDGVKNTSNNITSLERLIEIVKTINTFELDNQYTKDFLSWLKEKELLTDFTSSQNLARG